MTLLVSFVEQHLIVLTVPSLTTIAAVWLLDRRVCGLIRLVEDDLALIRNQLDVPPSE